LHHPVPCAVCRRCGTASAGGAASARGAVTTASGPGRCWWHPRTFACGAEVCAQCGGFKTCTVTATGPAASRRGLAAAPEEPSTRGRHTVHVVNLAV
jgi:hypothetical protein